MVLVYNLLPGIAALAQQLSYFNSMKVARFIVAHDVVKLFENSFTRLCDDTALLVDRRFWVAASGWNLTLGALA